MTRSKKLTRQEEVVLITADIFTPAYDSFAQRAASYSRSVVGDHVSEDQAQESLDAFLDQGLLQVVTEELREDLRASLCGDACHGPVLGFPRIGGVDFTREGADLYLDEMQTKRICGGRASIIVDRHTEYLFATFKAAQRALSLCDQLKMIPVSGPVEYGPWQPVPWLQLEKGYLIEVVEHYSNLLSVDRDLESCMATIGAPDIVDVFFHDVVQKMSMVEVDSSIAGDVCLAIASGLFGIGLPGKSGLRYLLRYFLPEECRTDDEADEVIEDLVMNQELAIASEGDLIIFQDPSLKGKNCVGNAPTPGHTFVLKSEGIRRLLTRLNLTSGGDVDWQELTLGEWCSRRVSMHYFSARTSAIDMRNLYINMESHIVGEIEEIGKWCLRWWDIRDSGFRMRGYENL
ncbi:hypothetical protein N9Y42_05625 [Mariniblastus sp.]|nr:hypothetical protein [Mariniblastus sp.]